MSDEPELDECEGKLPGTLCGPTRCKDDRHLEARVCALQGRCESVRLRCAKACKDGMCVMNEKGRQEDDPNDQDGEDVDKKSA